MSLVERAAKRLEELAKAEPQAPGAPGQADSSLVERAVNKVEALEAKRGKREPLHPAVEPADSKTAGAGGGVDLAGFTRLEPRLGDQPVPLAGSVTGGEPRIAPSGHQRTRKVELDFTTLTASGYLQPEDPESAIANEFRKIKRPLIQACQGKLAAPVANANRIMVTSSLPGEGKTFVSLNLALSIAMERNTTVLLIDADTTRRSLSRLIGIDSSRGLLDLLAGNQVDLPDALFRTNVERLTLLPAGAQRRHATELLASDAMGQLVEHLASRYPDRILIFDTPPLLGASEPAVLASHMGQIIVVVEADRTTHKVLTNALATIQSCPLVTTVLNKTSSAEAGYYYYYAP